MLVHRFLIAFEFFSLFYPLFSVFNCLAFLLIYVLSSRIEINADNEANYVVKVDGVDISPNPVVRGKPATFTISASTGNFPFL